MRGEMAETKALSRVSKSPAAFAAKGPAVFLLRPHRCPSRLASAGPSERVSSSSSLACSRTGLGFKRRRVSLNFSRFARDSSRLFRSASERSVVSDSPRALLTPSKRSQSSYSWTRRQLEERDPAASNQGVPRMDKLTFILSCQRSC